MTLNQNFIINANLGYSDNVTASREKKTANVAKVLEEEYITQLCMAFATIRDQVGSLESKRLKGGTTFLVSGWLFDREGIDDLLCMYLSSNLDI